MSEASISIDFEKAKRQAETLENTARDIKKLANNEIVGTLTSLRNDWKGESADIYNSKGNIVVTNLSNTAVELEQIAKDIRAVAKAIYDAEMEAIRIANERTSGGGGGGGGGGAW